MMKKNLRRDTYTRPDQEEVYLKAYENARQAQAGLERYFRFYNAERRHQALGRRTPDELYFGGLNVPHAA